MSSGESFHRVSPFRSSSHVWQIEEIGQIGHLQIIQGRYVPHLYDLGHGSRVESVLHRSCAHDNQE